MKNLFIRFCKISICYILFFLSIFDSTSKAQTPLFDWVYSTDSTLSTGVLDLTDIAIDQNSNVFYAGTFSGTVDFDPGPDTLIYTCSFGVAVSICKLDTAGNVLWVKTLQGIDINSAMDIKIDINNNLLISGRYSSFTDFDPGPGTHVDPYSGSFILKLDNNGNFIWVKTIIGLNTSPLLEIDIYGNIYGAGYFNGFKDFDLDSTSFIMYSNQLNTEDIFVFKLDSLGQFLWAKQFGGPDDDYLWSLKSDDLGYVYFSGINGDMADFDPNVSVTYLLGQGGYISKIDASGNLVWVKQFTNIAPNDISLDNVGNIYFGGSFEGAVDIDPDTSFFGLNSIGDKDICIAKLTNDGNFVWAKSFGSTNIESSNKIKVANDNSIIFSGLFTSIINLSTDSIPNLILTNGGIDLFVCQIDSTSNLIWSESLGGVGNEYPHDLEIDHQNNIYLGGRFFAEVDFNFGPNENNLNGLNTLLNSFLLKLNFTSNINMLGDSISICEGDSILLNSGFSIGNLWNTGDTSQYISVGSSGYYFVMVNSPSVTFFSDTVYVNVIPAVVSTLALNIMASDSIVCANSQISLSALNPNNINQAYLWSLNGVIFTSIDSFIVTPALNSNTTITAYLQNNYSCGSPAFLTSNAINIQVNPLPQVTLNTPQNNTWLCTTDAAFTITGGFPSGGIYSGSGVTNGIFTPSASLPNLNQIIYTYQDSNACIDQAIDTFFVDVCTMYESYSSKDDLKVYPVPTKQYLYINVNNTNCTCRVTDITGKVIATFISKPEIDVSHLLPGMYFIEVENMEGVKVARFLKE